MKLEHEALKVRKGIQSAAALISQKLCHSSRVASLSQCEWHQGNCDCGSMLPKCFVQIGPCKEPTPRQRLRRPDPGPDERAIAELQMRQLEIDRRVVQARLNRATAQCEQTAAQLRSERRLEKTVCRELTKLDLQLEARRKVLAAQVVKGRRSTLCPLAQLSDDTLLALAFRVAENRADSTPELSRTANDIWALWALVCKRWHKVLDSVYIGGVW